MYNIVILDCILHYFNKFAYLKVHVYEVILLLSKKKRSFNSYNILDTNRINYLTFSLYKYMYNQDSQNYEPSN